MKSVKVISPNIGVEEAIENTGVQVDQDSVRVIGVPKYLFEFHVEIPRILFAPREKTTSATVDSITGTCKRNDIYPELEKQTYPRTGLLNPKVQWSEARRRATSMVRKRTLMWYSSLSTPDITVERHDFAFKLFWVFQEGDSTIRSIDSISGRPSGEPFSFDETPQQ